MQRDSVISVRRRPFEWGIRKWQVCSCLRRGSGKKAALLTGDLLSSKPDAKASLLAQPPTASGAAAGSARAPFMPFAVDMMAGACNSINKIILGKKQPMPY